MIVRSAAASPAAGAGSGGEKEQVLIILPRITSESRLFANFTLMQSMLIDRADTFMLQLGEPGKKWTLL